MADQEAPGQQVLPLYGARKDRPYTLTPKHKHRIGNRHGKDGVQAYEPTDQLREIVFLAAANGVAKGVIAKMLQIGPSTLRRHYREQLDDAQEVLKASIMSAIAKKAMAGDLGCAKFWLAHFAPEWREAAAATRNVFETGGGGVVEVGEKVRFYMPSNHRDEPDPDEEGPVIEGEATAA